MKICTEPRSCEVVYVIGGIDDIARLVTFYFYSNKTQLEIIWWMKTSMVVAYSYTAVVFVLGSINFDLITKFREVSIEHCKECS